MIYTLEEIKSRVEPICKRHSIPALYLFGSYARDAASEESDIDFLVDTSGTQIKSLFSLGALYNELEEALGKRIDLITVSALRQKAQMPCEEAFRDTVWREKVRLYAVP